MSQELWERIPADASVVLYLADDAGRGAAALRGQDPLVRIVGAGMTAADALAQIEQAGLTVDAWVLGRNAWQDETLTRSCRQRLMASLRQGATLVWEVPSSQYWEHLLRLFSGQRTSETRCHVPDILTELMQAGVSELELDRQLGGRSTELDRFVQLTRPLGEALRLDTAKQEQRLAVDRVVLRGQYRAAETAPLSIYTLKGETKVCARVRVDEPHDFLARLPRISCKSYIMGDAVSWSAQGRMVWIWQRVLYSEEKMIVLQRRLLQRRSLTIQEWDDDPVHWEEHFRQSRYTEMRSAHAIQASTPLLADYLRQFNPQVKVFANCIASLPALALQQKPITTIFFGALNRQQDWAPIMPTLNRVLKKYGKHIQVVVMLDQQFFAALQCEQKVFYPFCPYPKYQELLQASDIALLPLLPTRFNQMKSDLKFLECAAASTAVLASPTVYAETVRHGETGLLYETEEQFRLGLERLIEDIGFRQRLERNAWEWVRDNRLLSRHYRERLVWYEQLFDRYDELTGAIGERVPALREKN